jgi:coenzyme F420-reducing hydrogenase beta subunit
MSSIKNLNTNNDEGLFNTVIKQDYCIGCGVCTAVNNSPFDVSMDKFGNFKAEKTKEFDNISSVASKVCPFSDRSKNEEELGEIYYPNNTKSSYIGNYIKNFAGKVVVNNFRQLGSSGGVAKWIGAKLLETNEIDFFIQLVSNETNDSKELLFDFAVFSNSADVLQGSKSAYYPVTLKEILKVIKSKDGRYAITGVPCYIKALRLLALEDNLVRERIKYTIGIVCGGMKSANQSKMIGWELGVHPNDLVKIDFRRKDDSRSARDKVFKRDFWDRLWSWLFQT